MTTITICYKLEGKTLLWGDNSDYHLSLWIIMKGNFSSVYCIYVVNTVALIFILLLLTISTDKAWDCFLIFDCSFWPFSMVKFSILKKEKRKKKQICSKRLRISLHWQFHLFNFLSKNVQNVVYCQCFTGS